VGHVAEIASVGDLTRVRYMALGAGREFPVLIMAGGTVKVGMPALILPELPALQTMTDKTGISTSTLE